MKFSVIMPVYLGDYPFRAKDPELKFRRAINTFLSQEFKDAELIIISDGCQRSHDIVSSEYIIYPSIKSLLIKKQPLFGGKTRQAGIKIAKGQIICYLDADDTIGRLHLALINEHFNTKKADWVYWNDWIFLDNKWNVAERESKLIPCEIGTSCIAHKRSLKVKWNDGYGHDWVFIEKYLLKYPCIKIPTTQYYVCHTGDGIHDF